jgi:DNA-binding transcriptional ArsR family regulator
MKEDTVFKALADPTRRIILDEFTERNEQTMYELCARLLMKHRVTMSRQAVAKHISVLEIAGLLRSQRRGKYRVLVFDPKPINYVVERWVKGTE